MSKTGRIIYFIVSLIFFILFDGYFSNLILKYGYALTKNPVFDFVLIQNDGAAFNIFQNSKLFLIIFAIAALLIIIFYVIKQISKISTLGLFSASMLCAGIFCNMYERIVYGFVRDFIKLNFINFPVFNISDILINIGVFVIVLIIIKNNYIGK